MITTGSACVDDRHPVRHVHARYFVAHHTRRASDFVERRLTLRQHCQQRTDLHRRRLARHHQLKRCDGLLLGERLPAEDAFAMGAINRCVEDDKVLEEAMALAERLASGPTVAIGQIRKLARNAQGSSLADAMQAEAEAQQIAGNTQDFMIGAQAFATKTKAEFKGK